MDEQSSSDVGSKAKQELNEEALKNFTTSATSSSSSSWTILPADRIEMLDSNSDESSIETKGAEKDEESSIEPANERCKPLEDADPQAEDFSDGISIISDCESTGRVTPSPMFRLLNDLNGNFELGPELRTPPLNLHGGQQLRSRRRNELEPLEDALDGEQEKKKQRSAVMRAEAEDNRIAGYRLPKLVQNGLTAVFYVGATLAILSFIGRLKNPEWQTLGSDKPGTAELEQRLVDLELQNNLMRAEIDIMSKQLNYLSGQGQVNAPSQAQGRKGKTFKAWPGNGNTVDPVDITKQDLKRPYKCPDGKFVEIAGMCMERKPQAESLADEIGGVVNDVLQQSQAFQQFEKISEKLGTLAGDQSNQASETAKDVHARGDEGAFPLPPQYNQRSATSKERYQNKHHNHKCREYHSNDPTRSKCSEYDSKERTRSRSNEQDSNEHSKERTRSRSNENDSNEHSKERTRSRSNENDSNEHSKERTRSKSNEYDSKERHHKKYADKSKERYGKKQTHRGQHNDDSGEWHERMMQQRANARQRQEQKRNNNWFIERGDDREHRRSGETRR